MTMDNNTDLTCPKKSTISEKTDADVGATFETTVTETGFGKFNILLILLVAPAIWSPVFETTTMSYVFAPAQCDLELSLEDKGYLNSITYLGMVVSAPIWGFLYDTLGRRKLLIGGLLLDALFVFMSSFTQSKVPLMACKFFGGLIINGPYAALITYLSEFHSSKYRPMVQLTVGTINTLGGVILPLLAWMILPQSLNFSFFNGYFRLHSWNVYLLVCGLPAFYSGIVFFFLPESPKFLMTVGQNEKALAVFQKVYSINTGKPVSSFPIKQLIDETKTNEDNKYGGQVTSKRTMIQALGEGLQQIKPLFFPPYLTKLILVCLIQSCIIQSHNMIRLWTPQMFQAIEDYKISNYDATADLCTMLELLKPTPVQEQCTVNMNNSKVYVNSIIVSAISMCGFGLTGFIINHLGKKKVMIMLSFIAGISSSTIFLAQTTIATVALCSLFTCMTSVVQYVVLSAIVDIFPTTLRTLTIAITMMIARAGAMSGNMLFPILLRLGCQPPFFYVGAIIMVSAALSLLMPNTENKPLK